MNKGIVVTDVIKLGPGQILIKEGDESSHMFLIERGSVAVFKTQQDGSEVQIATLYSGEVVGEMSFLDEQPRSASVRTIDESEFKVIPRDKFEHTYEQLPKWYRVLTRTLLDRIRRANSRVRI